MCAYPASLTVPTTLSPRFQLNVPGSKSMTNRALVLGALARGRTRLRGALVAQDTEVMQDALRMLGFSITRLDGAGEEIEIEGLGGRVPAASAQLDLKLSGTSIRFIAALVALGNGEYLLDGNERMRERPIGDLLQALNELGVYAQAQLGNGCPPVLIRASGLPGGEASVGGESSSQFLSALLMAAPYAQNETTMRVTGELQSKPFIDMTIGMMELFGAQVERDGYERFRVPGNVYEGRELHIEGDAMAAGYFWAAAAVTEGEVVTGNMGSESLQGDRRLAQVLQEMGCEVEWGPRSTRVRGPRGGLLRGGRFDLNDMPDQAQTLAAIALFAGEPVEIVNVANMRIKETDRLHALATELRKFGAVVDEREDGLLVEPPASITPARVATYGDHRMAMALAIPGLRVPGTVIEDPGCVEKTYPDFFADLERFASSGTEL